MDPDKQKKPKILACMLKGPGPIYQLKTLTGFDDHDPSKYRNPAYTMKFKPKDKTKFIGPGPYMVTHHLTHKGFELPPAYSMASKHPTRVTTRIPGPGAHAPERAPPMNHHRRPPAYTHLLRHNKLPYQVGPGPIYMVPTCIGPDIPDIRAEAAYSMAFKHKRRQINLGPGPAAYDVKLNVYKKQYPAYSMKLPHGLREFSKSPGPKYSFETNVIKNRPPTYSFGVKYSECTGVPITQADDI